MYYICFLNIVLLLTRNIFVYSENVTFYQGALTAECVKSYFRMYVTRRVPPRNYQYCHEALTGTGQEEPNATSLVTNRIDLQWRIVGGMKVSISDIPYQVMYGPYCGGTLIAPEWVITAAHCKEKETFVLAGSTRRSLCTKYYICAHFTHPLWNAPNKLHKHDYDFQLVLLERAIPITLNSRPIAIGNIDDIKVGAMVTVSGWGHLHYKESKMQDLLRKVSLPIMSSELCEISDHPHYKNITARMFCAGFPNGEKDSCQGDSGGPAVLDGKLVGLVSFGVGCAAKGQPGVYSAIPVVRDWIRQITALPL